MSKENEAVIRRWVDKGLNRQNEALMDEFVAEDFLFHGPGHELLRGRENLKNLARSYFKAFPDLHCTIDELYSAGDRVIWQWTFNGTHEGEFQGIAPTRKRVELSGMVVSRFKGGRIVEEREFYDRMEMYKQLGVATEVTQKAGMV